MSITVHASHVEVRRAVERGPVHLGLPGVRRLRRGQAVRRLRRAVRAGLAEGRPHGERTEGILDILAVPPLVETNLLCRPGRHDLASFTLPIPCV